MILFCVCTISKFQFCNFGFYALSRNLLMSVLILSNRMLPQYMPTYSSVIGFSRMRQREYLKRQNLHLISFSVSIREPQSAKQGIHSLTTQYIFPFRSMTEAFLQVGYYPFAFGGHWRLDQLTENVRLIKRSDFPDPAANILNYRSWDFESAPGLRMITGVLAKANLESLVSLLAAVQSGTQDGGDHRKLSADLANGNHKFAHLWDVDGYLHFYFVYLSNKREIISALVASPGHDKNWYTIPYFRDAHWLTTVQFGEFLLYSMLELQSAKSFAIHAPTHKNVLTKFHFQPLTEKIILTTYHYLYISQAFGVSHSHAEILILQPCLPTEWKSIQQYINKLFLPLEKQLDEELSRFESRKGWHLCDIHFNNRFSQATSCIPHFTFTFTMYCASKAPGAANSQRSALYWALRSR